MAARSPIARWRMVAALGVLAGLIAAVALPSSASAQGFTRVLGETLDVSFDGQATNSISPVYTLKWVGPASNPPQEEREWEVDVKTSAFSPPGPRMGASDPCRGGTAIPGGQRANCPSEGLTSYEVRIPSCCTTTGLKASHFVVGMNPPGADFSNGSVAGVPFGGDSASFVNQLNNIVPGLERGTVRAFDNQQTCGSLGGGVAIDTRGWTIPHNLIGGRCNDRIRVAAGQGHILRGGDGSDTLIAYENGARDKVICGDGFDRAVVDLTDRVSTTCQTVERAARDQHPVVTILGRAARVRGGRAAVQLRCPQDATGRCNGRLRLLRGTRGNRALGATRYRIRKGSRTRVRVRTRGRGRGVVRARATERDANGDPKTSEKQLRLR